MKNNICDYVTNSHEKWPFWDAFKTLISSKKYYFIQTVACNQNPHHMLTRRGYLLIMLHVLVDKWKILL